MVSGLHAVLSLRSVKLRTFPNFVIIVICFFVLHVEQMEFSFISYF